MDQWKIIILRYNGNRVDGGELYDKIVDEGEYTENETKEIVIQIIDAVEYLHNNGIAHRDLKVLIDVSIPMRDILHYSSSPIHPHSILLISFEIL